VWGKQCEEPPQLHCSSVEGVVPKPKGTALSCLSSAEWFYLGQGHVWGEGMVLPLYRSLFIMMGSNRYLIIPS